MTEMGAVIGVRNAAILATASVGSNGPSLLPSGLLRLLGALWLCFLRALLRLLALRLLRALLRLRFLCVLRLLGALWLRFLRTLLRLRFLCVLRWLGFSSASALFLLAF
ncbi:MAG: hypothetical protein ACLQVM_01925 [Terriglobia bacterium]